MGTSISALTATTMPISSEWAPTASTSLGRKEAPKFTGMLMHM